MLLAHVLFIATAAATLENDYPKPDEAPLLNIPLHVLDMELSPQPPSRPASPEPPTTLPHGEYMHLIESPSCCQIAQNGETMINGSMCSQADEDVRRR